ncbi:rho guanine nucleotide exchange factor 38-like isoform X1 [Scylla paramamosain]|uniref:rho guanine nucleotide exchange factor 38-like isoform X1 n=2 Tax=Scylla paramamosain TaxID=85552 RepID=UPI003082E61F
MWRNETDMNGYHKDDSCNEENFETSTYQCNDMKDGPQVGGLRQDLRSKRIQELVATERDYVTDLEALLHVADRTRYFIINPHILLGNTKQVLAVARRLLRGMEEMNRRTEKEQELGHLFLNYTEKLTQIYREYCSYYSVRVLPLLKKYEEDDKAKKELKQLAEDLKSLRPNTNSLNAALIKPVQRILRYPLYLDHLLEDTPSTHPDLPLLQEARTRLVTAAAHINEYTRGLDLAIKDYSDGEHSLHGRMRSFSLHSLAKKSIRMPTILSRRLGIMGQAECSKFEEEKAKFYSLQRATIALENHSTALLKDVRAMHISELLVPEALSDIMQASYIETIKQAACESYDRALKAFDTAVMERVLRPTKELATLCKVPARVIKKYHQKKLDYDASSRKKSARDELKSTDKPNVGEKNRNVEIYEALESLLLAELPVLTIHGLEVIITALQNLIVARLCLQGRMTHIYLQLAQTENMEPMPAQVRAQQQMEWLLRRLPHSLQKKHVVKDHHGSVSRKIKRATNERKIPPAQLQATAHESTFYGDASEEKATHESKRSPPTQIHAAAHESTFYTDASEEKATHESKRSPPTQIHAAAHESTFYTDASEEKTYTALYCFIAEDDTQLSLHPGMKVVPILKNAVGGWWFVKAIRGGRGYVPATYLSH